MSPEHGPLPEGAKQYIDQFWQERLAAAETEGNAEVAQLMRETIEFQEQHIEDRFRYSIEVFRAAHLVNNLGDSIGSLNISDELLLDVVWTGIWDVRILAEKMAQGVITEKAFLPWPNRDRKTDFETLQQAVAEWLNLHSEPATGVE
jgi:hypothetical protein